MTRKQVATIVPTQGFHHVRRKRWWFAWPEDEVVEVDRKKQEAVCGERDGETPVCKSNHVSRCVARVVENTLTEAKAK
ncbi:hypothetical protein HanIR_Chr07g0303801 [Helianthus annuus]|nr:hypothetical protein HanIR_Chr07g0303801 [Helianthus annuus]